MSALDRLNDTHVTCRAYGHQWEPTTVTEVVNARGRVLAYRAAMVCNRGCETRRVQTLDAQGYVVSNTYAYDPEYVKKPGEERITRIEARMGWITRRGVVRIQEVDE